MEIFDVLIVVLVTEVYTCVKFIGLDFPGGAGAKNLSATAGQKGLIPGLGRSRMPQGNEPER